MISEEIFDWLEPDKANRYSVGAGTSFHIATDVGIQRAENQDRAALLRIRSKAQDFWCACLCDGMGGMQDGGKAASFALASFFGSLVSDRRAPIEIRLERAINEASLMVSRIAPGGGATLSAVCAENGILFTANVGDSRIYAIDPAGELERLTVDDTMEEAYGSEGRGLLQYIGMKGKLSPHIKSIEQPLESIFLTSDGAHLVGDRTLQVLKANAPNLDVFVNRVLDLANWLGGADNATVVALNVKSPSVMLENIKQPDVSVWSSKGRLKFSWMTQPASDSSTSSGNLQDTNTPTNNENLVEVETKKAQSKAKKPRRSSKANKRKTKKEQIEIGFSDGGQDE